MRLVLATLLLLVGSLSACGSGDDPSSAPLGPVAPKTGQCVAGEKKHLGDVVPDLATVVPCTEPHLYEIAGRVAVPRRLLDESSPAASLRRRDVLASVKAERPALEARFLRHVEPRCRRAVQALSGLGDVMAFGKPLAQHGSMALRDGWNWVSVMPADLWEQGRKEVICSVRFGKVDGKGLPVRSPDSQPLVAHWSEPVFPQRHRSCISDAFVKVPCGRQHRYEAAFGVETGHLMRPGYTLETDRLLVYALCQGVYVQAGGEEPQGYELIPIELPGMNEGWTTCVLRHRPGDENLPMPAGFHAF